MIFSTNKKTVSQHNDQVLETATKTLVISFDQEKFEEILSQGGNNLLSMRKHRKIILPKALLVVLLKVAFFEVKQTQRESNLPSDKVRHAQCEPKNTSGEISKTV